MGKKKKFKIVKLEEPVIEQPIGRRDYGEIIEMFPWWDRLRYTLDGFYMMTGIFAFWVWFTILLMAGDNMLLWFLSGLIGLGINGVFIMILIWYPAGIEMIGFGGSARTNWVKAIVIPNTINFFMYIIILYFVPWGWLASSIWIILATITLFIYGFMKEAYEEAIKELGDFYTGLLFPIGMILFTIVSVIIIIVGVLYWI